MLPYLLYLLPILLLSYPLHSPGLQPWDTRTVRATHAVRICDIRVIRNICDQMISLTPPKSASW